MIQLLLYAILTTAPQTPFVYEYTREETHYEEIIEPRVVLKTLEKQVVYAYSSSIDETDDTPFITASGTRTRKGVVANNCYAFGTIVSIAEDEYVVEDRMNARYGCHVWDVWQPSKA